MEQEPSKPLESKNRGLSVVNAQNFVTDEEEHSFLESPVEQGYNSIIFFLS